jgi:branched-chain amino acid transport system permease protein
MNRKDHILYFIRLHRTGLLVGTLAVALAVYPLFQNNPYYLGITNLIGVYLIVTVGLNLFIGFAGQISLGHAGFVALGAYGSAIFCTEWGWNPWLAMLVVAALVGLTALVVGIPTLRLSGHNLAMATLGFNIVIYTILIQWDMVTGGPSGYSGIPPLSVFGMAIDDEFHFHYVIWPLAIAILGLALNLVRSGLGLGLAALAQNETTAGALGIRVSLAKIQIFVLSAILASLGGSLFAHCFTFINPHSFSIFSSLELVTMVVVGGLGSVWGSLFGTALIVLMPEYLEFFDTYKDIIHGLILVVVLTVFPQGLITGLRYTARLKLLQRRKIAQH